MHQGAQHAPDRDFLRVEKRKSEGFSGIFASRQGLRLLV
jgi:hypothetical protein